MVLQCAPFVLDSMNILDPEDEEEHTQEKDSSGSNEDEDDSQDEEEEEEEDEEDDQVRGDCVWLVQTTSSTESWKTNSPGCQPQHLPPSCANVAMTPDFKSLPQQFSISYFPLKEDDEGEEGDEDDDDDGSEMELDEDYPTDMNASPLVQV